MIDLVLLKPEELMARNSKSSRATKRKIVRMASTAEELHAVFYLLSCKVHAKNQERKCTKLKILIKNLICYFFKPLETRFVF